MADEEDYAFEAVVTAFALTPLTSDFLVLTLIS